MVPQLQSESEVASSTTASEWSLATRIGFRFVFSYFMLYLGPGAVGAHRGDAGMAATPYRSFWVSLWHHVVPWVGTNVLHLQGDFGELANGSGDQLYDYVLIFCMVALAVIATAVWSWLDRGRKNYEQLNAWLRMLMRLAIAAPMISYGSAKLFRSQFPEPPLFRLIDPLGQTSPMGLLWTFMGVSPAYSFFAGFGETIAGVLLVFPQLATLGALILVAVMSNVLMLNLCYDVPRKIFSIHLVMFGIFLILPELRRMGNLFVFNRPVEPARNVPLFRDKSWNSLALIFQIAFGVVLFSFAMYKAHLDERRNEVHVRPELRGIWAIDDFELNGISHPPLLTDKQRWQHVVFDFPDLVDVQMMDASFQRYDLRVDERQNRLGFAPSGGQRWKGLFAFHTSPPNAMTLTGQLDGQPLTVHLRRVDLSDPNRFLLINRGVHWVNPTMFAR